MGLGGLGTPRSQRVARIRAETGQGAAAQVGTPVCTQWSGPGQNCSDQVQNKGDRLDALQRVLLAYTCSHVWWCEGYTPDANGELSGDLNLHWCIIYLDDIVIFSEDLASHLERPEAVLWKLEEAGLKLKSSKCELFQQQNAYLRHVISAQGVATDKGKIKAIKKWPTPTHVTEVQSFLGFMGYYCWFIPKFAQVARPLYELTLGENAGKKKAVIQWNSKWQQAFDDLKRLCTTVPIIAYAAFSQPFKLHTDACGSGLGAILYQTHENGTDAVIAYANRSLGKAEFHYPAYKLEFCALKWAVVKKFHKYLYRLTFDMYTDNNPLTYVLTTAKLNAASHCWVGSLVNYNFQLYYLAGKTNIDKDTFLRLSCLVCVPDSWGTHLKVTAAAVEAMQEAALTCPSNPIEA